MSATGTNVFGKLWDDIQAEALKVKDEIVSLAGTLAVAAVADIEQVFAMGAPLAVQAILAEAPKLISGSEKFGNAAVSVMESLQASLGPVAIQDVHTLVQTAYQGVVQIAATNVVPAPAPATPPAA